MTGASEVALTEHPVGPWAGNVSILLLAAAEESDDPMVLRMADWRGCSALEYVPGRNGGQATFIGRRITAATLAEYLYAGYTLERFCEGLGVDMSSVRAVYDFMVDGPPVDTVDLTGCPSVELRRWGTASQSWEAPVFKGVGYPVEALFDFLKAGLPASDFADAYEVDLAYEHVEAVLRHAADQGYQGPLG